MTRGSTAQRDQAIDTVRGLCIVTMVAAHLSRRSALDDVTHPLPWVDGAVGFVLLSGLLIGLVQRSTMERRGTRAGFAKLGRRTRLIYLGHVLIAAVALLVGTLDTDRRGGMPSVQGEGGPAATVLRLLTLQINPAYASVLSLYVVVMIASVPLLWLLRHGRPSLAAGYVVVAYGISVVRPEWTQLPEREGAAGGWSYGCWFGLFGVGVLIGWFWRTDRVQRAVTSRAGLVVGASAAVAGVLVAAALSRVDVGIRVLEKEDLGPGRILLGIAVYFVIWRAARWATARASSVVRPLTLLGTRSLDSYLILSVLVIVIPSVSAHEQSSVTGMALAAAAILLCASWAAARTHFDPFAALRSSPRRSVGA